MNRNGEGRGEGEGGEIVLVVHLARNPERVNESKNGRIS